MTFVVHDDKLPEGSDCLLYHVTGSYLKVSVLGLVRYLKNESLILLTLKYFNSSD